jgi:hypothetical protein
VANFRRHSRIARIPRGEGSRNPGEATDPCQPPKPESRIERYLRPFHWSKPSFTLRRTPSGFVLTGLHSGPGSGVVEEPRPKKGEETVEKI